MLGLCLEVRSDVRPCWLVPQRRYGHGVVPVTGMGPEFQHVERRPQVQQEFLKRGTAPTE